LAQKYLTTKDLDIVLAGNAGAFRDALKKEFPNAQYEEIPFDQVDVLTPGLHKPKEVSAGATPESLAQGREILLAASRAAGGDSLASVSSLSMAESGKLSGPNGKVPLNVKWLVSYPDRSRADVTLASMSVVQVCDGNSAWFQFPSQTRDASQMIGEFERGMALFGRGWGFDRQVLAGTVSGQSIGEEEMSGKKTLGVAVQGPFGSVKLYFDASTHLLFVARYESSGPRGASDSEQRWSDDRTVDGRQFAFSSVIDRDGAKFAESTIQELNPNPKGDDSLFTKPQSTDSK
jgi:hypothetical protein